MRILHLVHQYPPNHLGGTELYTVWLTRALQRQGHDVAVFHRHSTEGVGLSQRDDAGITIWSAWNGRFQPTNRLLSTFQNHPLLQAFGQVCADFQPDLVHVQHLMGLPTKLLNYLHRQQIPYVVTLWDFWWVCANAQLLTNYSQEICHGPNYYVNCAKCALARAKLPQFPLAIPPLTLPLALRNSLLRHALQQASKLIAPAQFVKQWYVDHGLPADKIIVQPPGLDYPTRPTVPAHTAFRVGYLGGLSWQKGVHVLVEAFDHLPETAELWIAGDTEFDPDYANKLRRSKRPTFVGKLNRQQVWEMLAQLDVLVVPSLWYETFAFVISEAFAMGVPVITNNLGVLAERVRHGVDGLLVAPDDVSQLAHALQTLHDDPDLLLKLRLNVPEISTIADHTAVIVQLYQETLQQKIR